MKSAARVSVSVFGLIVALAGLEHGVGEVLQGNVAPEGIFIESWPNSPEYEILGGEPAMTIVPNLLVSGILTTIVALAVAVWSIKYIGSSRGGLGLIGLSVLLLLVGGGFGPPLIGFILGGAATRINSRGHWLETNVSEDMRATLAGLWRFLLGAGIVSWLSVWPGLVLLSLVGISDPLLALGLILLSFVLLISTLVAGFAYDSVHSSDSAHAPGGIKPASAD